MQKIQKFNLIKKLVCISAVICFFVLSVLEIVFYYNQANKAGFIINIIAVSLALVGYIICNIILNTSHLHKLFSFIIVLYFLIFMFLMVAKKYNLLNIFNSPQKLKEIILSSGSSGVLIFILIQVAQVIISPIPGAVTIFVGSQIYGELLGFVYSSIGIIIGSILAFLIGKAFGKTIAQWVAGEEKANIWSEALTNRGKLLLPIIFLLPLFPDDIICIICGSTKMSFKYFFIVALITRPIGIFISSYLFGGNLIPFYWPYTLIWISIILVVVGVIVLIFKNQKKIENWLFTKLNKKRKA